MKKATVPIIGLTGQTGAGKSTVASRLRAGGLSVIDADQASRQVMQPGSRVLEALAGAFGSDILLPGGALNRPLLAQRAFRSPAQTEKLNALTHPAIIEVMRHEIAQAVQSGAQAVVLDAPQLFESGSNQICDWIIAVVAPEDIRLRRIMARDQISENSARLRANAQKSEAYYREHADILVRNFPPFDLAQELKPVWEKLCDSEEKAEDT